MNLSDKAKKNLQRNEESRRKESKYIKLEPGEKRILHFDAEKMEPVEVEFDGKKSTRYQYTVTDPNDQEQSEKYFTLSKRNSALIDTFLTEGQSILKIHRIGAGKDTQYLITASHTDDNYRDFYLGLYRGEIAADYEDDPGSPRPHDYGVTGHTKEYRAGYDFGDLFESWALAG
jgi:hypothetical protein